MNTKTTRRCFLRQSAQAAAVTAAVSTMGGVHISAAANPTKVNLGVIGCGGIMGHHVSGLVSRREDVVFNWLCDVDPGQFNRLDSMISGFQKSRSCHRKLFF